MRFLFVWYYSVFIIILYAMPLQVRGLDTLYPEVKESFDISGLGAGQDIAVTEDGDVYITSSAKPGLWHLKKEERSFDPVYIKGVPDDYFFNPAAIEIGSDAALWIANPHMHEILVCDTAGYVLGKFDRKNAGLQWPTFLFPLADGKIGAWDKQQMRMFLFDFAENKVISQKMSVSSKFTCLRYDFENTACFDADDGQVIKISEKNPVTKMFSESGTKHAYPKIRHMESGPGTYLFYTDFSGKHMGCLSPDLEPAGRFLFCEHLFIQASRFTFQGSHLWIIDEGRQELIHVLVKTASTAMEHFLLGEEYLALGYFDAALEEIQKAESLGQKGADTDLALGKAYYGLKQYGKSLSLFAKAAKAGQICAHFWMGNALFRLGRYAEAGESYQLALKSGKDRNAVLFNLAQTCMEQKQFAQARDFFTCILSEEPDHLNALSGLAQSLIGLNRLEDAMKILIPLAKEKETGRTARYDLGRCYLMSGQYKAAIPLLERAAAEGPFFRDSFLSLEKVCRMIGDNHAADQYRQKAEEVKNLPFSIFLLEDI